MRTTNICIFGDSIAYGAWDASGGWVDRLRSFLHTRTIASNFTDYYFVYHLAIPGNTTHDVLARFAPEAAAREPHVIICAAGINDARYRDSEKTPHVAEDIFRVSVGALIAQAKEKAPRTFFVGLTPVDETKTMPYEEGIYFENANIARHDAILKEMTEKAGVGFIEVYDTLDAEEDLEDGLHPNVRGHEKLFRIIRECLVERDVIKERGMSVCHSRPLRQSFSEASESGNPESPVLFPHSWIPDPRSAGGFGKASQVGNDKRGSK